MENLLISIKRHVGGDFARAMQSTPESGARAGFDGHKKKNGCKMHMAVDTLGNLLALHVIAANEHERAWSANWPNRFKRRTDSTVKVAFADQGYTGEQPAIDAANEGIDLVVVKHTEPNAIRAAAATLGRRANFRMARALSTPDSRL